MAVLRYREIYIIKTTHKRCLHWKQYFVTKGLEEEKLIIDQ